MVKGQHGFDPQISSVASRMSIQSDEFIIRGNRYLTIEYPLVSVYEDGV